MAVQPVACAVCTVTFIAQQRSARYCSQPCRTRASMGTRRRAECHPDKPHIAHGLCSTCVARRQREIRPDLALARTRRYRERHPHLSRDRQLAQYGLTRGDYIALRLAQGGRCAACADVPERDLDVDHDHNSGRVRGLLCNRCNRALGLLGDNAQIVRALAAYIDRASVEVA